MAAFRAALISTLVAGLTCVSLLPVRAASPPQQKDPPPAGNPGGAPAPQVAAPPAPAPAPPPSPAVGLGGLSELEGRRVRDIEFRGVAALQDPNRLRELIPQKVNQPLDKRKLRASLQTLYATGRFQDLQVEAEPAPQNELSLVFVAKENYFVAQVTLFGAPRHGPTDFQLVNASKLRLGELFTEEKMAQASEGIQRVLQDNGYHRAAITPQYIRRPETQQIYIHLVVDAGEQARIGKITVAGEPGYSPAEISDIAKFHSGDPVSERNVTRALQRLRKRYQKKDRLEAQVSITDRTYLPETNTVDYAFRIVRGPTVDIHVEGARLSQDLIKKYVPVYEEGAVDEDLLNEGRRNLRDYFQTRGYFESQVSVVRKEDPGSDHTHIIYDVNRGERHKLVGIQLQGNRNFPDDLLRDLLQMQPAGWLLSHGLYSQAMLTHDVQAIEAQYRLNGFRQVKVTPQVIDDYQGRKGQLLVILRVAEGPQTLVNALTISGNKTFPQTELLPKLTTIPGQPFAEANLATDRDTLVNFYFNSGFPQVTMNYASTPVPGDPTRMNVTYTLDEGERVFVNQVLVGGLNFTRPYVVNQELLLHPGDPLSQSDMLLTQSRLYDLGIFSQVDLAVQNPEGEERYKDVLLDLGEARRYTFDYGLGFEVQTGSSPTTTSPQGRTGFSPRVSFDMTRLNFRGRNHTIFFKSHLGRLQRRALLSYEVPRWFNRRNLKLTFNTFYDNTRDVRTFTAERIEGSIAAEQAVSRATTLLYHLSYRRVRVDPATLVIDPNLIPLFSRPVRVAMPGFTYVRDTRDDRLESHKGNFLTFDAGISSHVIGSQSSFSRFLVQQSSYHAFGRKRRFVFARSTRLGIEQPYNSSIIPLPELFFAGGGNSLRGFAINQAGPRDLQTGFPLGGEAMFINNLELRFPPVALPFLGKSLSPVLFHDMGNVLASASDLFPSIFRINQRHPQTCTELTSNAPCDFAFSSHAVGGGIRYKTPIGPVRLDIGYNLNPPTFPIRDENRFETLHRFNFFFSIGQTF